MKLCCWVCRLLCFTLKKWIFFSINFSPLKKWIFKKKRIWSWWWLWVPSHIEDYVYLGLFFEVSELIFSTNFCFPNPFAIIYVQIFVSKNFFFSIGHQFRSCSNMLFLMLLCVGSKSGNGDDSISSVGGGILRWVAESVLLVLRKKF